MIITLTGATFSTSIGTLDSWFIQTSITGGGLTASESNIKSIRKDDTAGATLTYTYNTENYKYTNGTVTDATGATVGSISGSNGTVTVTLNAGNTIKGKITIAILMEYIGSGEGGGGDNDTTDPTPDGTVITYTSRQSPSGISKSTGEYLSSSTGYVNIYENIDPTKTYAATSYAPLSTGDNACVCYYTTDGTFISAESGSDWGISSVEYTMQELTVPSNASTIKLFGRTNNQEAVLYLTSTISMTEISYSSQSTSSNLNETNGTLGTSSTGYVNVYDNIDASKTYYASGFCPKASGTAAFVCYYTSDEVFISAQDGNDFGASSENVVKQKLTVPSTTSTIKVFAQSGQTAAALYVEV